MVPGPGKVEMKFTGQDGKELNFTIFDFVDGGGVAMGMYNTDKVKRFELKFF